ncbi:MAG: polymerase sigma-70 factor, subfamily [Acidobacteriota bacterium]|jgi:RNA polymerase sigma-70 factor (ECF subfamily)|nr:polymerase sigma-70 factor, subfamily [Acidobacteriota bacterium]MDT5270254.1 polymerase sigma-70 factor, subfamily [Acidobacteriota bacterium]MDT7780056.1 polymerase sigma-70 factor, subfamily [Acidobacteriota bacterium]
MTGESTLHARTLTGAASAIKNERVHSSDFCLAQKASKGDMEAFEEIYRRHQRLVYGLCLRMTQNVAEAEDIVQEVFITLFHKVGGFRGESAFTTWLHRLTINQVLMHFRKRKSRKEEQAEDDAEQVDACYPSVGTRAVPLIDRIALDAALAKLPPGYRAAFVLYDIEGYEHEEVARILGCAVGTSKSQLHKARVKLRKILKSHF